MNFNTDKFYLGKICKYGHEYQESGQSLRYLSKKECVECVKEQKKRYYQKNPDKFRERNKRYRQENPDKVRERNKRYYQKNPDKVREINKRYYQENSDKVRKQKKRYYQENSDKVREYHQRYSQENPDKFREYQYIRRSRIARCHSIKIDRQVYEQKLAYFKNACCYCHKPFDEDNRPTWDHFLPISKGGSNVPSNLVPCCKSCNSAKKNKDPMEFLTEIGLKKTSLKLLLTHVGKSQTTVAQLPLF